VALDFDAGPERRRKSSFDVKKATKHTGYACLSPWEMVWEARVIPQKCGRCHGCIARMKADRAGRAQAQGEISAEVIVLTLTNRRGEPGAEEFRTIDRSRMFYRLRSAQFRRARKLAGVPKRAPMGKGSENRALINAHKASLTFFGVGEVGKRRTKRHHWHIMVFADKVTGIEPSVRYQKGKTDLAALALLDRYRDPVTGKSLLKKRYSEGEFLMEVRDFWPHGGVSVDVIRGGSFVQAVSDLKDRKDMTPAEVKHAEAALIASMKAVRESGRALDPAADRAIKAGLMPAVLKSTWDGGTDTDRAHAAIRYSQKYVEKTRGAPPGHPDHGKPKDVVFFQSLGKAFGASYIESDARRTAAAGLPYHGTYQVPGVNYTRKNKALRKPRTMGEIVDRERGIVAAQPIDLMTSAPPQKLFVQGACRKYGIAAYRDEWVKRWPGRDMPWTLFMQFNDPDFSLLPDPDGLQVGYQLPKGLPFQWHDRAEPVAPMPEQHDPRRAGVLMVEIKGVVIGSVEMWDTGAAKWHPNGDRYDVRSGAAYIGADPTMLEWLPVGDLSLHLPFLSEKQRKDVEWWIRDKRGLNWVPPNKFAVEVERRRQVQEQAIAKVFKPEVVAPGRMQPDILVHTAFERTLHTMGDGYKPEFHYHKRGDKLRWREKPNVVEGGVTRYRRGWLGEAP